MEEVAKAMRLIDVLFSYYDREPRRDSPSSTAPSRKATDVRAATDYIAGMTDRYRRNPASRTCSNPIPFTCKEL